MAEHAADARGPVEQTFSAIVSDDLDDSAPTWAKRSVGSPLVGPTREFFTRLANASSTEEVVHAIAQQSNMAQIRHALPAPVATVLSQIQREAESPGTAKAPMAAGPQKRRQSTRRARVARGFTGIRSPRSKATTGGPNPNRVAKLAGKLQDLIHLAEHNRDAARQEVRMAEDTAEARAEGQGAAGSPTQSNSQADIDALSREVLQAVMRELEIRAERQQHGAQGDVFDGWW